MDCYFFIFFFIWWIWGSSFGWSCMTNLLCCYDFLTLWKVFMCFLLRTCFLLGTFAGSIGVNQVIFSWCWWITYLSHKPWEVLLRKLEFSTQGKAYPFCICFIWDGLCYDRSDTFPVFGDSLGTTSLGSRDDLWFLWFREEERTHISYNRSGSLSTFQCH